MNRHVGSLILLIAASACTLSTPDVTKEAVAGRATYYCREEKLTIVGDNIDCNWTADPGLACHTHGWSHIAKGSIVEEPKRLRRCENGDHIAVVTTR